MKSHLLFGIMLGIFTSNLQSCQGRQEKRSKEKSQSPAGRPESNPPKDDDIEKDDEEIAPVDPDQKPNPDDGNSDFPRDETALLPISDSGALPPEKDPLLASAIKQYFNIHVVDKANNQNISGAVLTTTHHIKLRSDKNGFVAFYEPGLMNTKVWFSVSHPGYEIKKDFFGNQGSALDIREGGSAFIYMDKTTGQQVPVDHEKDTYKLLGKNVPLPSELFGVRIVDQKTGRGVPIVRLLSSTGEEHYSDNQGFIAFDDTTLIGKELDFKISSDGYDSKELKIKAEKGKVELIKIVRRNIAERLYRSTGAGSYRDSVLLGYKTPVSNPHIDGLVVGQDTLNAAIYKSKVFWIWQDTSRIAYPLGNFGNSGAMANLPSQGNVSQDLGFNRQYYVDGDGFSRPMTPNFEPANEPTWMGNLVVLPNAKGEEKMYGIYGKATGAASIGKKGWGLWDDASATFKDVLNFAKAEYVSGQVLTPSGDPEKVRIGNKDYLYYGAMRVPATVENLLNIDSYETFSPYASHTKSLQKNEDGSLNYAWRKNAYPAEWEEMTKQSIPADQILNESNFRDMEGQAVVLAAGTLEKNWNEFRKRFIGTIQQKQGTSLLGESWIAEADSPLGPWNFAKKVISHDRYTFYNLQQHPFFDREGGRLIYIHGTYTNFFTNEPPTPRHDYNQVLYRVDLADPKVQMPVAVYDASEEPGRDLRTKRDLNPGSKALSPSFYALESKLEGHIAMSWSAPLCSPERRLIPSEGQPAAFHILPYEHPSNKVVEDLYEFTNAQGRFAYSTKEALPGYTRQTQALGKVWKSLSKVKVPVGDYLGSIVAHAGDDQCLTSDGQELVVKLDGNLSRNLKGAIKSYEWFVRAKGFSKKVTGAKAELSLAKGLYFIDLKVTGEAGETHIDRSMIEIK